MSDEDLAIRRRHGSGWDPYETPEQVRRDKAASALRLPEALREPDLARLPDPPAYALHPDWTKNRSLTSAPESVDACKTANPTPVPVRQHVRGDISHYDYSCTKPEGLCLYKAEQEHLEAWRQQECRGTGVDPFRFRDVDPDQRAMGVDHAAHAKARLEADMEHLALVRVSPAAAAGYSAARLRGVGEADARQVAQDTAVVAGAAAMGLAATGLAKGARPGTTKSPAPIRPTRPEVTTLPGAGVDASRSRADVRHLDLRYQVLQRDGAPPLRLEHVFHGEVKRATGTKPVSASGFHHEGVYPYARAKEITKPADANGVYKGRVEVFDEGMGRWVGKKKESSFFPREWSQERVMEEIRSAYPHAQPVTRKPNVIEGRSTSGVVIQMVVRDGKRVTAYPVYKTEEQP